MLHVGVWRLPCSRASQVLYSHSGGGGPFGRNKKQWKKEWPPQQQQSSPSRLGDLESDKRTSLESVTIGGQEDLIVLLFLEDLMGL